MEPLHLDNESILVGLLSIVCIYLTVVILEIIKN